MIMEQEKYKGRTLLCLFHFPHLYQMLLIVAAEVPTSGDYKLNFESLLHQAFHKMLMTQQPPPPPNEHKSHNWTQSLNYMVMHPSNSTAVILHVVIVIWWSLQLGLWNLNSTSISPVAPCGLGYQISANQQEAEMGTHLM